MLLTYFISHLVFSNTGMLILLVSWNELIIIVTKCLNSIFFYKSMNGVDFLEELIKAVMLTFYWTVFVGTISSCFWALRRITLVSYNYWVDAFVNGIYLRIVETCWYKRIFNYGIDDADVRHCNKLSAHICWYYSSCEVFCVLDDYCRRCGLLSIWLRSVSIICYWLVGIYV